MWFEYNCTEVEYSSSVENFEHIIDTVYVFLWNLKVTRASLGTSTTTLRSLASSIEVLDSREARILAVGAVVRTMIRWRILGVLILRYWDGH